MRSSSLARFRPWLCLGAFLALLFVGSHSVPARAADKDLTEAPDFRVRVQAALRLGRGGVGARADLERGLRDTHPAVRVACAVGLGNLGDKASVPALEQAQKSETFGTVKTAMKEAADKIRAAGAGAASGAASVDRAKYVVQIGTMKNQSGVRTGDLDNLLRSAARSRASTFKNAVLLEEPDANVLKKASERKIPVLQLDGNLTRLTQVTSRDGGVIVSARVDMAVRRVPQQTLKGTVSGNASASDDARAAAKSLGDLQNRAINGAVESAISMVSSEIAQLAQ